LPFATANFSTDANYGLVGAAAGSKLWQYNAGSYVQASVGTKAPFLWTGPDLTLDVAQGYFVQTVGDFNQVQQLP
jgi:hypothetical protein